MIKFSVLLIGALLIGITKAGFGGGAGLIVGPMLMLVFPAKESLGMMLPLLFVCDVVSLFFYWRKWDKLNIAFIIPGAVVGIGIGSIFLGRFDDRILAKMIGISAIGFALLQILLNQLIQRKKQFGTQPWLGILVGAATGFFSTVAHLGGVLTMM
ncbi:MAG: sulfite exporter TauE/SafE family protein, partial [Candidatus Poribacteria bacterium]|nr:sulfite exporter TauE/SafE family protein [Candidatus Poribacteria bacterium]